MRLIAMASAEGCRKFTVSCSAMSKLSQVSERFWLDCLMVVVSPDLERVARPETTSPFDGAAWTMGMQSESVATMSLRLRLLRPRRATKLLEPMDCVAMYSIALFP